MIRVSKIAHAVYETPDLSQQTEYYSEIIGLTLAAQEKDTVYLASTVDHHAVVLRKGSQAQCTRIGFQIPPSADLDEFQKQVASHGIATERRKHAQPSISDMLVFTAIAVFMVGASVATTSRVWRERLSPLRAVLPAPPRLLLTFD